MLEIKYSSPSLYLNFSVTNRSILFLENFTKHQKVEFNNLLQDSKISKDIANLFNLKAFCENLTINQNLHAISGFIKSYNIKNIILKYFHINSSIYTKKLQEMTEEEKFILSISFLFFNQKKIWFLEINDVDLSEYNKDKVKKMMISKRDNSEGIIFYSTKSNQKLAIEKEIILTI